MSVSAIATRIIPNLSGDERAKIDTDGDGTMSEAEFAAALSVDRYAPGRQAAHTAAVAQATAATELLDHVTSEQAHASNVHGTWKVVLTVGSIAATLGSAGMLVFSSAVLAIPALWWIAALLAIAAAVTGIVALIGERVSNDHESAMKSQHDRAAPAYDEAWRRICATLPPAPAPTASVAPPAPVATRGVRLRSIA